MAVAKVDLPTIQALMEASTVRTQTRILSLLLLLPFCHSSLLLAPSTLCRRPRLEDSISPHEDQCRLEHSYEFYEAVFAARGVLEVNGTELERSLQLLNTRYSMHAAVLVYARWCPFSRALVPMFDSLSSSFPSIYHFAVEEASLHPSAYAYYGVHSFPVLFFHNKTVKVRYQGPRTYEALTRFYKGFSGFQPVVRQREIADGLKRGELGRSLRVLEERKLQDEFYLVLSFIFLVTRVLLYLLPRVMNALKQRWAGKCPPWKAHRILLQRVVIGSFEKKRPTSTVSQPFKGKNLKTDFTQETGKVLLSVPRWPSSSLAPVSLAEGGSSSKSGAKEDVRDNGHVFKNYSWA